MEKLENIEKKSSGMEPMIILIYLALKPLYLFPSGLPQISDMFLMVGMFYLFVKHRGKFSIPNRAGAALKILGVLVVYQTSINIIYTLRTGEDLYLISLFYIFNLIAFSEFIIISSVSDIKRVRAATATGAMLGIVLSCVGLVVYSSAIRQAGFFNNPNQLGYYGVIVFSLALILEESIPKWKKYLIECCSFWAVFVSGSKAGFIALSMMMVAKLIFHRKKRSPGVQLLQLFAAVAVIFTFYLFLYSDSYIVTTNRRLSFMRDRLLNMQSENDSNLGSGRGYNRIAEIGLSAVWGVGEGAYERFETLRGLEVHSSYATMVVCYGYIGLFLLYLFVLKCIKFKGQLLKNLILSSGILLYWITHNGLRNTIMWIFWGVLLCESLAVSEEDEPEIPGDAAGIPKLTERSSGMENRNAE